MIKPKVHRKTLGSTENGHNCGLTGMVVGAKLPDPALAPHAEINVMDVLGYIQQWLAAKRARPSFPQRQSCAA